MGESHVQDARPTVQGRSTGATATDTASLKALSGNTKTTRKRQSQGNSNQEPPAKRYSHRKRETEDDWADYPVCNNCKMRHPKEDNDVCWYLHPEQAKPWFNKTKAAERLKEFRKKSLGS
jgi:hypothetical protein